MYRRDRCIVTPGHLHQWAFLKPQLISDRYFLNSVLIHGFAKPQGSVRLPCFHSLGGFEWFFTQRTLTSKVALSVVHLLMGIILWLHVRSHHGSSVKLSRTRDPRPAFTLVCVCVCVILRPSELYSRCRCRCCGVAVCPCISLCHQCSQAGGLQAPALDASSLCRWCRWSKAMTAKVSFGQSGSDEQPVS